VVNTIVFVVEDEPDIAQLISHHLSSAGYEPKIFTSGEPALKAAELVPPALFLLDIMLPQGDGLELCRRIRSNSKFEASRIIFLTALSGETDRVVGLELGADDYIAKPFSPRELIARVRAVLRRGGACAQEDVLLVGDLKIDTGAMSVTVAGRAVEATVTEFRILEVLVRSAGRVVSRQRLIDQVWGTGRNVESRSIDVYVSRLREKIESGAMARRYFKTIRGIGYCIDAPAAARSASAATS
jgi:DNA-binding response OmpR family regulator